MTARPAWADAMANILSGMAKQKPKPLLAAVAFFADVEPTPEDFVAFVAGAEENDGTLSALRLALAMWDSSDELDIKDPTSGEALLPRTASRRRKLYELLGFTEDMVQLLDQRAPVFEDTPTVISKVFEPWYRDQRGQRSSVYWDDYSRYLREDKGWPAPSIASLDETSTEIVERLSDPTRTDAKQTKGLVVGYVQSGKTANFTGVIAKAIDAGYRLVIVLTGTIEILRAQTQRRIDMELVGRENILAGLDPNDPDVIKELDYQDDEDWIADNFVRHGVALDQPTVPHIRRVTTHHSDYKRLPQGLTQLRFQRHDKSKALNDPTNLFPSDAYLAVVKKNKAPLQKLLKDLRPIKKDLVDLPILIIDDESDQASVDTTNPNRWRGNSAAQRQRTTINKLISELMGLCPRAQYVGYTATPFANVFIDPDDESDLFPSDFLLSLHRPPGYMGVQEFHDVGKRWDDEEKTLQNCNELAHVRALQGMPATDPEGRREELQEAVDAWVLSGAVKKYREAHSSRRYRHHTMLVHESVKQADHFATAEDVRDIWKTSAFTSGPGLKRLRKLWDDDFLPVMDARADEEVFPKTFDELKIFIAEAIAAMTVDEDPVLVLNSDQALNKEQKKLDFDADQVWRILVGGTQLSRGFTVEGLTVSYFRRRTMMADTLMQAGRWFGFRPGYQDLVRLYIRRDAQVDLYDAFEALLMDEEAFREELRQYEGLDENGVPILEPRHIPPLVSQHLPWLRPTARNKMWNAVIDMKATARGFQDLYGIQERGRNQKSLQQVGIPLLNAANTSTVLDYRLPSGSSGQVAAMVGIVDARELVKCFESKNELIWCEGYREVVEPLLRFMKRATDDGRIKDFAVIWPQPAKVVGRLPLSGLDIPEAPVITRARRNDRIDFIGSDAKHRAAALPITQGEAVVDLEASTTRGAVLAYLVDDRKGPSGAKEGALDENSVVVLMSIALPAGATPAKRNLIQWTVRVKDKVGDAAVLKTLAQAVSGSSTSE